MKARIIIASCFVLALVNFAVGFTANNRKQLLKTHISALTTETSNGVKEKRHTYYTHCEENTATISGTASKTTTQTKNFITDGRVTGEAGMNYGMFKVNASASFGAQWQWGNNTATSTTLTMSFTFNAKVDNSVLVVTCGPEPNTTLCYASDPCEEILAGRIAAAVQRYGLH